MLDSAMLFCTSIPTASEVLAILGQVADPVLHRIGRRADRHGLPCTRISPASTGSAPNTARATSVRPAPINPAKPRISPQREADIANRATARQPAHFERDVVRGRIGRRAEFGRELAADHHRDDRVH